MAQEADAMEDGQLSDSDSDMTVAPSDKALPVPKVLGGDIAVGPFQNTASACAPVSHYRNIKSMDSSDESFSDSDDDNSVWKRKRQKCFNPPPKPEPIPFDQSSQKPCVAGKKINNIWGAVLQEQNQDAVATELGILGMEGTIDKSRQSETYNYLLAKKLKRESEEHTKELDKELDEYMRSGKKAEEENGQSHLKRKRPVKDRIGPRVEMNYKGRYEISEEDSQEKVADEISFSIFYIENQKEYENQKAARKRRTQVLGKKMKQAIKSLNFQEDDDTSRETFASDTNEALASLDEPQEGHGETKLDTEESFEVDHSHDIDIF
ncbi:phosphorylated adapter RNA export protein [Echinops telfairi]|uniref:Phosphorylated adapter RNA export protein n=1 Tax=Echinops telfairi TaxID=9371 RepID=A0ABM0ICN1_ECHTE|nr:phosphorylated adapter RNA export protein [Echinops telfairi]